MRRGLALDVSSELPLPKEKRERKKERVIQNCGEDADGRGGGRGCWGLTQLWLSRTPETPPERGVAMDWKCSLVEQVTTLRVFS